jgi:two-component system, cell cycle sensor histidine kinase and response regulator CckA
VTFVGIVLLLAAVTVLLVSRQRRARAGEQRDGEMNVSERTQSEKLVADALGYAQTLLETSPVGVITYRASGEGIAANRAAAAMLGGTVEQLKAGNFRALQSWKSSGLFEAAVAALETGSERRIETPVTTSFGRQLWIYCNFVPFQFGGETQLLTLLTDVTERKRTEAANALFRELLDRSNDIIEVIDPATGRLLDVNGRACQELGYDRPQILSLGVDDLYPATGNLAFSAALQGLRRPASLPWEGMHRRKDGSTFPVEVSISHVRLDREYAVAMVRDVTRERLLHDQLRQAQKMETIGQFAGAIAHDFNNLLSIVMTYASLLAGELERTDPRRADAEEIERAAARAAGLTRQLLAFSRAQLLEPSVLDLHRVASGMEKMLRRLLTENIELVIKAPREPGSVRADAGQVEQVIMNMAVNARDAMPEGGKLVIETANVELDEASAPEDARIPPGSYVMLAVSDTGTGMDAETRRRAFEPFFTTKEKGKGSGLGLSTCYGIVQHSGGHISVYSQPGKGTVFRIYLPRLDQRPDAPPVALATELRGSETILVVEDDDQVCAAAKRLLEGHGYEVQTASSHAEALAWCEQHGPPDLLLSDVVMPGGNGIELAERIKAMDPRVKVLLMSGYTEHSLFDTDAMRDGLTLLQKPFTRETLGQKVREALTQ